MVKSLSSYSKFIEEITLYRNKAKNINNSQKQKTILEKINKLRDLVENIDAGHKTLYGFQIKPSLLSNTREDIVQTRRDIRKLLNIK